MKIIKYIFFIFLSVASISCSTLQKTTETNTIGINEARIGNTPLITDLDIRSEKVEGKAIGSSTSIKKLKQFAVAEALSKANADLLIEPKYSVETKNSRSTVIVVGWPANYKNFRQIVEADSTVLMLADVSVSATNNSTKAQDVQDEQEKKKITKARGIGTLSLIFIGTMLITGLIIIPFI